MINARIIKINSIFDGEHGEKFVSYTCETMNPDGSNAKLFDITTQCIVKDGYIEFEHWHLGQIMKIRETKPN